MATLNTAESQMVVARSLGRKGNEELLFNKYKVSIMQDRNVLEIYMALPLSFMILYSTQKHVLGV